MIKTVILDRDGVINYDSPDFIKTVAEWQPIPGSLESIARLKNAGFAVYVASNQSGLARGLLTKEASDEIFAFLKSKVAELGANLDGIVCCPHHPSDHCDCRKPKPGLFFQLRDQFNITLSEAFAVGDSLRDIEAASAAGAKPILVKTGNGLKTQGLLQEKKSTVPTYENLAAFVEALLHD